MGCTYGFRYKQEEHLILDFEQSLSFASVQSKDFAKSINNHSKKLKLTEKQFIAVIKELKIDITESISRPSKAKQLFERFLVGELYDKRSLILLGILYGKGSLEEKAKILFLNYSLKIILDTKEIKNMIHDVIEVALVHALKSAKTCVSDNYSNEKLKKYYYKLNKYKPELKKYYKKLLIKDFSVGIKLDEFILIIQDKFVSKILCPSKIRSMAFRLGGGKTVFTESRV
ncbi:hypothetical protein SteCoe_17191 [Stentor coeruleus]|uniref:Uncharacterized protein n=1 Tax=Stentor coeruleus TaxID=5963 RepID=A0A1R2BZF4_9CILI|nr:hypothetical protein SteCoe_17191 [Stentor coeruleus]